MSTQDPYSTPPAGGQPHGQPSQQPAGPGGYGSSGGGPPANPRNGLGIASLVLGILAFLTGFLLIGGVLGIIAIVLGFLHRGRTKRREATGVGLGIAGIVLGALGLIIAVIVFAIGASFLNSDQAQQLIDCLEQAQGDQAATDQCRLQFEDSTSG